MAGRSSRGGGRQRWLAVGLVVSCLVLIIDASIKSADPGPGRTLAAQAWLDRALVIVDQSNVEGAELAGFRTATTSTLTGAGVTAELAAVTTGARASYRELAALRPPALLQGPAGLLETCLQVRSLATEAVATTVLESLGEPVGAVVTSGPVTGAATSGLVTVTGATTSAVVASNVAAARLAAAAVQLQVADSAYRLFAADLPASLGIRAPTSTWVTAARLYSTPDLEVFVRALRSRISLAPTHLLSLVSVGTTPPPLGSTGPHHSVEVLSPSATLAVTAIVGDVGNQAATDLTVRASISGATGTASAHQTLDLAAGAVAAVTLAHLAPPLGRVITLTVTVSAPASQSTPPVTRAIRFEMPAPTASTTTTAHRSAAHPSTTTTTAASRTTTAATTTAATTTTTTPRTTTPTTTRVAAATTTTRPPATTAAPPTTRP